MLWPETVIVAAVQALLQYCKETREVQLVAGKSYKASEPIKAMHGIQQIWHLHLNRGQWRLKRYCCD